VGAKEVISPQGLDAIRYESNINGFATAVSVWAMLAITGANIGGTRKSTAEEKEEEEKGDGREDPCDMFRAFPSLDDLDKASTDMPMLCRDIHVMQVLTKMNEDSLAKFKELKNGYDDLFEKYKKAFTSHLEDQLREFMSTGDFWGKGMGPGR
jgi:hypothetical protein